MDVCLYLKLVIRHYHFWTSLTYVSHLMDVCLYLKLVIRHYHILILSGNIKMEKPSNAGAPWSNEDTELLKTMTREKKTSKEMALYFGRTDKAINAKCRKELGINVNAYNPSKMTPDEVELFKSLNTKLMTDAELAHIFNKKMTCIHRVADKCKIHVVRTNNSTMWRDDEIIYLREHLDVEHISIIADNLMKHVVFVADKIIDMYDIDLDDVLKNGIKNNIERLVMQGYEPKIVDDSPVDENVLIRGKPQFWTLAEQYHKPAIVISQMRNDAIDAKIAEAMSYDLNTRCAKLLELINLMK